MKILNHNLENLGSYQKKLQLTIVGKSKQMAVTSQVRLLSQKELY